MSFRLEIPVCLIAFNRPDTTKAVFKRIREAKPKKLYIAIDGARKDKEGELEKVEQVKKIVQEIDWQCETHYRYNDRNKGAEITVSSSVLWALEKEEFVIVLEDDIVAPLSFFKFMQEMLIKYKDNVRVNTVTGSNFTPIKLKHNEDYFFAKYGHSGGGWGTWKRAWQVFDLNALVPDEHLKMDFLRSITNSDAEAKHYRKKFKSIQAKGPGNSTWDNIGLYFHRINNSLSIIPRVNLTSNIGVFGLHARGETDNHNRPFDEGFVVINHPDKVECNTEFDIHHFKTFINKKKPLNVRIKNKISRLIK